MNFISELNTTDITFTSVFHPYHPNECRGGVAWFFAVHDKVWRNVRILFRVNLIQGIGLSVGGSL